jgi:hypothetical protein
MPFPVEILDLEEDFVLNIFFVGPYWLQNQMSYA